MKRLVVALFHVFAFSSLQAQDMDAPDFSDQKTKAIKLEFFSPMTGNTTFRYEQYLKDWISMEGTLGIIGLGKNYQNQQGVLFGAGIKFKKKPDFYLDGMKGYHIMQGKYLKAETLISIYSVDSWESRKEGRYAGIVQLVFGKQSVLGDIITIDRHFGLGYALVSSNAGYHYGFASGSGGFPISVSCGLSIGVLLK